MNLKIMTKLTKSHVLILALCFVLTLSTPTLPQGIHSMHVGQFQQNSANRSQQVMAYYDFNEDEYCDALTIVTIYNPQDKTIKSRFLTLYLWDDSEQFFVKSADMNLSFLSVVSVIATQFYNRKTAQTDVVMVYNYVGTEQQAQTLGKKYASQLIKLNCEGKKCAFANSFGIIKQLSMFDSVLPSIIILEGKTSLLYRKNNEAFVLNFFKPETSEVYTYETFSLLKSNKYITIAKDNTEVSSTLAYELSYFGDYNGDGIADLLVSENITNGTTSHTKIHFFKYDVSTQKFILEKSFDLKTIEQSLSTTLQFYTLQDINFDGKIDLILLFKSGLLEVHYNKIPSSRQELITPGGYEIFPFDLYEVTENYAAKIQRIKLPSYVTVASSSLLFGDFNLDGYDDLIVDFQYEKESGQVDENGVPIMKWFQKSVLLINQPCTVATDCGQSTFNPKFLKTLDLFTIRKFSPLNTPPTTYKTNESYKMFFIDLYKDGQLDLLIHRLSSSVSFHTVNNKAIKARQIQVYFNNVHYDAFFMKVRVMRGSDYGQIHTNLVLPGGCVNFFVTGLSGQMLPKMGNQYTQVGRVMQLPYVFFGLGRTNNYVNQLTVTIPYVAEQYSYEFMWTPIIPNSQILTLANPQGKWTLTAFIEPTKRMGTVSILVVLSLIVIGFFICRLTVAQKAEDKENLESFYTILR